MPLLLYRNMHERQIMTYVFALRESKVEEARKGMGGR